MSQSVSRAPAGGVLALLRFENVVSVATAALTFHAIGGNWWVFAALFLLPDVSMLGYLVSSVVGARTYNLAHTYVMPAVVAAMGWAAGSHLWFEIALIWCAHIGVDRALGFGLKYREGFGDTHLGLIGPSAKMR